MPRRSFRFLISAGVAALGLSAALLAQTSAPAPAARPILTTTTRPAARPAAPARTPTTTAPAQTKTGAPRTPPTTIAPAVGKPPSTPTTTARAPATSAPKAPTAPKAPAQGKEAAQPPTPGKEAAGARAPVPPKASAPSDKANKPAPPAATPERMPVVKSKTQPSLDVVRPGYNRLMRPGQWAPVQLMLRNPTARDATVKVVIFAEESDGGRQPMVTHSELTLPARAMRRHMTYALVDRCDRMVFELYEKTGDTWRFTSRQIAEPFVAGARELISVAFSSGTETYGCRQDEDAKDPVGRMRFYNPPSAEDLPERWAGYDPVDVMIVGALPAAGMTVSQETAIVDWVRAGGLLILSPGLQPDRYAGTVMDSISPVQVVGVRRMLDIPTLTKQYGPFVERPEGIGVAECVVRDGVVQQREGLLPLVVVRREGAGAVAFVAFDLSSERVTGWSGLKRFYRTLVNGTDRLPRTSGAQTPVVATEALNQAVGVRVLPRWAVALVMGLYLAGVVGALHFMRGRREWAFVILLAAAPLLAVIINFVGLAASGVTGAGLAELHVVRSKAGQTGAFATSYYALLSPGEARVDVTLTDRPSSFPSAPIAQPAEISRGSAAAAESARATVDFLDADVKSLHQLHVRPRAITTFESIHGATLPGALEVTAGVGAEGLRVQVANRSNRTLRRAFVICNRSVAAMGDLAAGQTQTVLLTPRHAHGMMAQFAGAGGLRSREDIESDRLLASLFMRPSSSSILNTGVMVTGWMDVSPAPLQVAGLSDTPQRSARTLWMTAADLHTPPGRLFFPKGALTMTLIQPKAGFDNGRWQPTTVVRTAEAEFLLPPAARSLKPSRIEFHLATSGAPAIGSVEAFNYETGQYDLLLGKAAKPRPDPAPLDRSRFVLSPPEKYLQSAAGSVRLRLAVGPESAAAVMTPGARQPVTLSDCDLEIEGTLE